MARSKGALRRAMWSGKANRQSGEAESTSDGRETGHPAKSVSAALPLEAPFQCPKQASGTSPNRRIAAPAMEPLPSCPNQALGDPRGPPHMDGDQPEGPEEARPGGPCLAPPGLGTGDELPTEPKDESVEPVLATGSFQDDVPASVQQTGVPTGPSVASPGAADVSGLPKEARGQAAAPPLAPSGAPGTGGLGDAGLAARRGDGWAWRASGSAGDRNGWDERCLVRILIRVPGRGVPVEGTRIYTTCGPTANDCRRASATSNPVCPSGLAPKDGQGFESSAGVADFPNIFRSHSTPDGASPRVTSARGPAPTETKGGDESPRDLGFSGSGCGPPARLGRKARLREGPWKLGKRKEDVGFSAKGVPRQREAGGIRTDAGTDASDGVDRLIGFVTSGVPRGSWGLTSSVGFVSAKAFYQAASRCFQQGGKHGQGSPVPVALRNPGERLVFLGLATPVLDDDVDTLVLDDDVAAPVLDDDVAAPVLDDDVAAHVLDNDMATPVLDDDMATPVLDDDVALNR